MVTQQAIEHVCRISRIVSLPGGHALLVGVGGSGKQSLARLAAHLAGVDVYTINASSTYGMTEFRNDLLALYNKVGVHTACFALFILSPTWYHEPRLQQAGAKGIPTALLLTDGQIVSERFLVWLHNLLAQGHIADLCGVEERDAFVAAVRGEAKAAGVMDTPDTLWQYFISKVVMGYVV